MPNLPPFSARLRTVHGEFQEKSVNSKIILVFAMKEPQRNEFYGVSSEFCWVPVRYMNVISGLCLCSDAYIIHLSWILNTILDGWSYSGSSLLLRIHLDHFWSWCRDCFVFPFPDSKTRKWLEYWWMFVNNSKFQVRVHTIFLKYKSKFNIQKQLNAWCQTIQSDGFVWMFFPTSAWIFACIF